MNPGLVICLALSVLTAFVAAAWVVTTGWGWLAGLAVYSAVGSLTLFITAVAAQPGVAASAPVVRSVEQASADQPVFA